MLCGRWVPHHFRSIRGPTILTALCCCASKLGFWTVCKFSSVILFLRSSWRMNLTTTRSCTSLYFRLQGINRPLARLFEPRGHGKSWRWGVCVRQLCKICCPTSNWSRSEYHTMDPSQHCWQILEKRRGIGSIRRSECNGKTQSGLIEGYNSYRLCVWAYRYSSMHWFYAFNLSTFTTSLCRLRAITLRESK